MKAKQMMPAFTLPKSWAKEEIMQSSFDSILKAETLEHEVMNARVIEGNFLKAERIALTSGKKIDSIQKMRTSLARGNLREVRAWVNSSEANDCSDLLRP